MKLGSLDIAFLCASLLLAGCASPLRGATGALPTASPDTLVLINGTLIDGTGAEPVPDAVLVIQGERIAAVGPRASVQIPAGARTVDVDGAAILPGLINAHVHNTQDRALLEKWAQAGVTTVRDVGAPLGDPIFAFRDAVRKRPACARIVAAGPIVTVPGGYPISGNGFPSLAVRSPEDARAKVNDLLDQGADLIKIALQSGQGGMLSLEETTAIVAAAHERGTVVAAHVGTQRDVEQAIAAGVDDINHRVRISDELVSQMVAKGIYWVPTFDVTNGDVSSIQEFVKAGGQLALGNDAGYLSGAQLGLPLTELIMLRDGAGLTPLQVITAATRNAAHVCNLEQELGTLEAGRVADVLVVNGDPLQDIKALANVRLVIHAGVVIRNESP